MAIPTKCEDLISMGYSFDNESKCRGCGEPIEWWITPRDKKMPMTVQEVHQDPENLTSPVVRYDRVPHWSVCPNAGDFRKKK